MVMSEGWHVVYCIIGQFTNVLRSLVVSPLEEKEGKIAKNIRVFSGKLDTYW